MDSLSINCLEWGVASVAMEGEAESGDAYLACASRDGMLFAAIDGLGHGSNAAKVSRIAIEVLARHASEPLDELLVRCHDALRPTRGATISLAAFNTCDATLSWLGVGNVEGLLLRADRSLYDEQLLLRSGVIGLHLPRLQVAVHTVHRGDVLVLVTDGMASDFALTINMTLTPKEIAERILAKSRKRGDDALALVARYRGNES